MRKRVGSSKGDEFGDHVDLPVHRPGKGCRACKKFVRTLKEANDLLANSRRLHRAEHDRRRKLEEDVKDLTLEIQILKRKA